MPAYVIAHIDVKDPVRYQDYKRCPRSASRKFGGRFLARGAPAEVLEGTW